MSYFVTGATGFIGRHLVERLLEREGDISVLVRADPGRDEVLEPTLHFMRSKPRGRQEVRQRCRDLTVVALLRIRRIEIGGVIQKAAGRRWRAGSSSSTASP